MDAAPCPGRPRRILVIHTDAQSHDMTGFAPTPGFCTPHLERLARAGTRFTRAYACNGVCVPSRAVLMTGRYPLATGVTNNFCRLAEDQPRLGRIFRAAGFTTGYFGKTHFGSPSGDMRREGWEEFFTKQEYNALLAQAAPGLRYPNAGTEPSAPLRYWRAGASRIPDELYHETVVAERAMDFLRRHRDRDALCFASFVAPHGPFTPPPGFYHRFAPADMRLRPRHPRELEGKPSGFQRWVRQNQKYLDEEELRVLLAVQADLAALVDHQVGRMLDMLDAEGMADGTLVLFTSDHGDFSSAYGMIGKSWCMDDVLLRIPLVVRGPGVPGAAEVSALAQNCDVLPTLLDWAGLAAPKKLQGRSLLPLLRGGTAHARDEAFAFQVSEYSADRLAQSMIVRGDWKYVATEPACPQLFNLAEDPREWHNRAGEHALRDVEEELRSRLLQWHIRCTAGYHDPDCAGYWEDETSFYDDTKFRGERNKRPGAIR